MLLFKVRVISFVLFSKIMKKHDTTIKIFSINTEETIIISLLLMSTYFYIDPYFKPIIENNAYLYKITSPIAKQAARSTDPIHYADEAIKTALKNQNQNPDNYEIAATLPEGYEYQKPFHLKVTYKAKSGSILIFPQNISFWQTTSEPLTGPNVLKATLENTETTKIERTE